MTADFENPGKAVISPVSLAHVVLKTNNFAAMREFYMTFLGARASFEVPNQFSFLTYDHEHHRVAIVNMPHLAKNDKSFTVLEHIAFTHATLEDLAMAYLQRKENGILPVWPVNHGPTTSIYYR